ncbi:MAG: hypothetical protein LBE25_10440 [Arthrobacter sp.]|jgi:hypothetical protein|nr:hypothetical protein [Arthrobacter sp.]
MSALFTQRLGLAERRSGERGQVAAARALSEEQRGTARAPWEAVPGLIVTPDAYASVAAEELRRVRCSERPDAEHSELSRGFEATLGHDGVVVKTVGRLGLRGTVMVIALVVVWSVAIGTGAATVLARVLPASASPALLPFLSLATGLALALVPWGVTALVFALRDGGLLAKRRRRREARERLANVGDELAGVTARWDETLLELAARGHGRQDPEAFARSTAGLDAALDSALRSELALQDAPVGEQGEAPFLDDVAVLGARVGRLRAQQDSLLGVG